MQTQLLPTTLSNQVPERSKIQHPPASQLIIIGKHGRGLPRGLRPTSVNTPSDTICVFIMLLFTIRYYTNIINVQPTAFNFPLYFIFSEHSNTDKMKKRRTVADSVANVGESGDRDRCLGTSVAYVGVNTCP